MPRAHPAALVAALVALVGTVAPAAADDAAAPAPDYFSRPRSSNLVTVRRSAGSRTRSQKLLIGGLAAGAVVVAGAGLYFHLDANRIADDLSADTPQSVRWDDAHQDKYDRGQRDGTLAIVAYVLAAGLTGGVVAAVLLTDPGEEVIEAKLRATAELVPGGGTVGAAWRW